MSSKKWLPPLAFIAATAVLGLAATPVNASAPGRLHPRTGATLPVPQVDSDQPIEDLLSLPPITEEQNAWMARLERELGQADNYVSTEVAHDRKTITVTWFGEVGQALSSLLASPPPATATLLRMSPYSGEALRRALARTFAQPLAGVRAVSGGVAVDGTSIHVEVEPERQGARVDVGSLAATIGDGVPVTVTVTDESVTPFYGRWNDRLR